MSEIERELEEALHRALDPIAAAAVPARRAPHPAGFLKTVVGGAGAALTVKVLTGVAVAAAAVSVAATVTTGSINPVDWGQQVRERVDTCKSQLADGQHGIGDCVSSFANQHGSTVSSDARHHGNGNGNGNANGNGNGNGNPNGNGGGNGNGSDNRDHGKHTPPGKTSAASPAPIEPEPLDQAGHPPVHITPGP